MTGRNLPPKKLAWLLGVVVLLAWPWGAQAAFPDLKIAPDQVEIGTSFDGCCMSVSGEIPRGSQAVIEVIGQASPTALMRKGRRAGLWMNVGEIKVEGAPSLYLAMSTAPDLLSSSSSTAAPEWGYQALQGKMRLTGRIQEGERGRFLEEFLQLKESEGLYGLFAGALKVADAGGERLKISGTFSLPAKISPGTYQVRLSILQEGQVVRRNNASLKVVMVGFPALLSDLAYQHGALYGILAVVIAIVTGFLMGFIFKGKAAH